MHSTISSVRSLIVVILVFFISLNSKAMSQSILEISQAELGGFDVKYTPLQKIEEVEGATVLGQVVSKPGAEYQFTAPFDISQTLFHGYQGQFVNKGDRVATIKGFDVHHFIDERNAAKRVFLASEKYYQAIMDSADARTFKSDQWLDIVTRYEAAKLQYEHFAHLENIIDVGANGMINLISPVSGILLLPHGTQFTQLETIFSIVPERSLLTKVQLPTTNIELLTQLVSFDQTCRFTIEALETVEVNFKQTVWLKPNDKCRPNLGQQIRLTPKYTLKSFKVPHKAITEIDNRDFIIVKHGENLKLEPITIIGKSSDALIIKAAQLSDDMEVLTESVSIVQGLLLGMGG